MCRFAVLIFIACFCSACSPNWPHRYDTMAPYISFRGFGKVVVLTRDNRPDVVSGQIKPQQVGEVESMFGSKVTIETGTGHSLAQDMSVAICNSLVGKGFECVPLVSGQAPLAEELNYVKETQRPARVVFLTINEWDNRVYFSDTIKYDLALKVFNPTGDLVASVSSIGSDKVAGWSFNPAKQASTSAPQAMSSVLQSLLGHEQVFRAMNMVRDIDVLGSRYN